MTVVVQQIVYTSAPERWWALAVALGFFPAYEPSVEWGEFEADGILAVHHAIDAHPAGACDLHLLVDDLDGAAEALSAFTVSRALMDGVGEVLTVRPASGLSITVSEGARPLPGGDISVQPIWFQRDVGEARTILEALGLRPSISAEAGGWVELTAAGGTVGVHEGEPRIGLSFVATGDLDALATRLTDAGFTASVVDEAYARTVRIVDPDGGDEIWVNGTQDDLYGYRRES
ncbi:MAG: hypothetical protein J7484_14350 [Microbacterium sp.]|nr:hypothetical protein [Microbacterium sp.]